MTRIEELEQSIDESVEKFRLEINKFKAEIENIKALAELKESKKEKWKPKDGETFWFRNFRGESESYVHEDFFTTDKWLINNLPIFSNKEECERYWHFMDTVKEKSYEFSEEEWEDEDIKKWRINCEKGIFTIDRWSSLRTIGAIYFKTESDAQYIIDNFKEELLKYWI